MTVANAKSGSGKPSAAALWQALFDAEAVTLFRAKFDLQRTNGSFLQLYAFYLLCSFLQ